MDVATRLDSYGWAVHSVSSPGQALEMTLSGTDFRVGLAALPDHEPGYVEELENFFLSTSLQWIVLVSPDALKSPDYCKFIFQSCYDYHTTPIDAERLSVVLGRAYGMAALRSQVHDTRPHAGDDEMVGTSPQMRKLFQGIRKVATADAPVLITGETGTGKELTAQAIHERSSRRDGPLVILNCGSLPDGLVQSELFGHEKGAFTGATGRKKGHLESAHGGTLFLDEVGELPLDQQTNLLRFLQQGTINRVGNPKPLEVDARIIAATNVDLEAAIAEGHFREDLYYRLNVLRLEMPALRDRGEDIEVLAKFFFRKFAGEGNNQIKGFSKKALTAMRAYHWPGNVRELINKVRRAMVMSENRLLTDKDLGLDGGVTHRTAVTLETARTEAEHAAIKNALELAGGNVTLAAKHLAVSRVTLYRLMEKHRIEG